MFRQGYLRFIGNALGNGDFVLDGLMRGFSCTFDKGSPVALAHHCDEDDEQNDQNYGNADTECDTQRAISRET